MRLAALPLALLPANPHYFVDHGRATVLVTSGEHYGPLSRRHIAAHRTTAKLALPSARKLQFRWADTMPIWHDPTSGNELGRTTLDARAALPCAEHSEEIVLELRGL